jgi:hypothetical protein
VTSSHVTVSQQPGNIITFPLEDHTVVDVLINPNQVNDVSGGSNPEMLQLLTFNASQAVDALLTRKIAKLKDSSTKANVALQSSIVLLSKRLAGSELFESVLQMVSGRDSDQVKVSKDDSIKAVPQSEEEAPITDQAMQVDEPVDVMDPEEEEGQVYDELYGDIQDKAEDIYGDINLDTFTTDDVVEAKSSSQESNDPEHVHDVELTDQHSVLDSVKLFPMISSTLPYSMQVHLCHVII